MKVKEINIFRWNKKYFSLFFKGLSLKQMKLPFFGRQESVFKGIYSFLCSKLLIKTFSIKTLKKTVVILEKHW